MRERESTNNHVMVEARKVDLSIITPVYNAKEFLEDVCKSIVSQTFTGSMEWSIFDDASSDKSIEVVHRWLPQLEKRGICVVMGGHSGKEPKGVGYAKNRAIDQSSGRFLCFMDADDVMHARRIELQYAASLSNPDAIVGCQFCRIPCTSTPRYTRWANSLTDVQLRTQAFTSFGPTIIQPSWFCSRDVFLRAGPFVEDKKVRF
ncbi:queuosine-tRNA galactosyltransferase-like [Oscarella lobularis]|uniref:queuosine-tRNA galactosyltransferase-like n=1 Tax=Oscarella lobularis TaxID=121494 RepID=UPI0033137129